MTSRKRTSFPARSTPTPRGVERELAGALTGTSLATSSGPIFQGRGDEERYLAQLIRDVPDFPKPGILFRDITPLLADPRGFHSVIHALAHEFIEHQLDAVVAIESRGFIFGAALAARLNLAFVPVRKPGKLPARARKVSYHLEYGSTELEMHEDALRQGSRVLIVDDVLATGGTANAAAELVRLADAQVAAYAFVIELLGLGGRARLAPAGEATVCSVLRYP